MKSLKTILTGAIAMTLASQAFADVTVYLTGSTAYRKQINVSIAKILGVTADGTNIQGAFDGTSPSGANISNSNRAVWRGTVAGVPGTVTIKTCWTGSTGGIQATVQPVQQNYLGSVTLGNVTTTGGGTNTTGGNSVSSPNELVNPEITMMDTAQVATPFTVGNAIDATPIGIVDFVWVAGKDSLTTAPYTSIDNVTPQIAQALFGGTGKLPVSYFTGNAADSGFVFATGRNPDSGTRAVTFAESQVGLFSTVQQYFPSISGGNVTSHVLWPAETVNGIPFTTGNSGYASGGNLRTALQAGSVASIGGIYISYLSESDARSQIGVTLKELKYNGVMYGTGNTTPGNVDLIRNGKYTFWGYESVGVLQSLNGDKKAVADALTLQAALDAPIKLNTMNVSRQTEGGVVTP